MDSSLREWEALSAFESSAEYRRLLASLNEQVKAGTADSIPVERPYSGSTLWDEHWFKNRETNETWRIVAPDPPFRGVFKKV